MKLEIKGPFEKLLHMESLETSNGFARVKMPYSREFANPHGFLHGGAICSLADTAVALAMAGKCGERKFFTAKMDLEFKAPVNDGEIFAEARIVKKKGKFFLSEVVIKDSSGKVLACGSFIYFLPEK